MKTPQIRVLLTGLSVLAFAWFAWSFYDFYKNRNEYLSPLSMKAIDEKLKRESPAKAASAIQKRSFADYQAITDLNATGIVKERKGPEAEKPVETPKQSLANVLRVLYIQFIPDAPEFGRGYVQFIDPQINLPSKERFLAVGDRLPPPYAKVFLKAVESDHLLFRYEDEEKEEKLKVQEFDIRKVIEALIASAGGRSAAAPVTGYSVPETTREARPGEYWISYEDADRFERDYQSVLRDVKSSRYFDPKQRKHTGIKLDSVPSGLSTQYGVYAGDIVKSINGNPVSSTEEAINWVKKNSDLPKYVVEIDRQGKIVTKVYVPPPKKK